MSHRKETEAMALQPIEDWTQIPWRKLERSVYRLQKRIYQASLRGNDKTVHNLQRLLMKFQAARTLAVRKVTQDNQGKRTAGIDGVKSVETIQRFVGFVCFKHWRLYGERGLSGEEVSVWVYEGNLKMEYQATTLALYDLAIDKKTGKIVEGKNPRRLETHFCSPPLDLWRLNGFSHDGGPRQSHKRNQTKSWSWLSNSFCQRLRR